MQTGIVLPVNESPTDALAKTVQLRPDGSALLRMHEAMGNLVQANGALCQVNNCTVVSLASSVMSLLSAVFLHACPGVCGFVDVCVGE